MIELSHSFVMRTKELKYRKCRAERLEFSKLYTNISYYYHYYYFYFFTTANISVMLISPFIGWLLCVTHRANKFSWDFCPLHFYE